MDEDDAGQGRSELWSTLQKLTQKRGIQRDNLLEALKDELSELQRCWGVNLANGPKVAKDTILVNLKSHFEKITLPPPGAKSKLSLEKHEERYWQCVQVGFNVLNNPRLLKMDIGARRAWLNAPARGSLRAGISTSQRYLNNAITQIEEQILASGYTPVSVDEPPEPEALSEIQIPEEPHSALEASVDQSAQVVSIDDAALYLQQLANQRRPTFVDLTVGRGTIEPR